jgi:glutaredoxin
MNIIIAATKTCTHRPKLEEQLQEAGLKYELQYFEDHPELIEVYELKTSPLLIVDDKVVSVGMPEHSQIIELKNISKTS